jgi:hypothetical protein
MGAPQLADWVNQHWTVRLAAWRCVLSKKDSRGAQDERSASSPTQSAMHRGVGFILSPKLEIGVQMLNAD